MEIEIRVELLEPDKKAFMLYRKRGRPEHQSVSALSSPQFKMSAGHVPPEIWAFVVTIGGIATAVAKDAIKDAAKDAAKKWIAGFISKLKPSRARINDREGDVDDKKINVEDVEKIIEDELGKIDIGKND